MSESEDRLPAIEIPRIGPVASRAAAGRFASSVVYPGDRAYWLDENARVIPIAQIALGHHRELPPDLGPLRV